MDRYAKAFSVAKTKSDGCLVPFTILGWPNPSACLESIKAMIEEGATALELGIAFSDPVADGPTIQRAAFETLDSGFTVQDAFGLISKIRQYNSEIPIGVLTYMNIVLARGPQTFFAQAKEAGVDSVLIADLPPDLADELTRFASDNGIALVFIISPLTSPARLQRIAQLSSAYVYVVSRLGITGANENFDSGIQGLLASARAATELPLLVGFGISSALSAQSMMNNGADGVITGSKVIEIIREDNCPQFPHLRAFLRTMRESAKRLPATV
jgi:tryptophan synthase alpha chain